MSKTIVLGSRGQLASELRFLTEAGDNFIFLGRDAIDISHPATLVEILKREKPTAVVNSTAYVDFNKAESNIDECRKLNVDFVERVARLSSDLDFHLVHFSTDYVFDGKANTPYTEEDDCYPLSVYGQSKLDGERRVLEFAKSATVVRTAWLYSAFGHNFLKTMLKLADGDSPLRVVNDQTGSPTWARELAQATIQHFVRPTGKVEMFHFAGAGQATWYEFATTIMNLWNKPKVVMPISTSEFPAVGERPRYSVLSRARAEAAFDLAPVHWKTSLERCLETGELK